ncbi:MAG: COG4315 family predicted lipoprotein [Gaiellaceae bacterium]
MRSIKTYTAFVALAAAVVLVVSACGGGGDSGAEGSAPGGSTAATTVSVSTVDGVGDVLVDAQGAALYASDQEADGMVLCTDLCATIWEPLTVDGDAPTGSDGIADSLGVAPRPDGARQVTFDGRLLYSFVEDPGPGTVTGNGFADTFDGQAFTWHVATPTGVSTSSANSGTSIEGYDF